MEDNIQTIVVIIVSIFLLFIFPVYMAYEKKDDISYSLAMRYTQDLVDEVRNKGYISKNMYDEYKQNLEKTGNSYDIKLTHEYNRYDPITNYYKIEDNEYILVKTTTQEERIEAEQEIKNEGISLGKIQDDSTDQEIEKYIAEAYRAQNIHRVEDTYKLSKEVYTTSYIQNILNSERKLKLNSEQNETTCSDDQKANDGCQYAYIMNVDDNFNITIKNTNTTLATVIYNMVTANTLDNNTRIYVNYGGTILSNKWQGNIDYTKMKHDNLSLNKFERFIIFEEERRFYMSSAGGNYPTEDITQTYDGEYIVDFDVKPSNVTELRQKGPIRVATYDGYNFAIGNSISLNSQNTLSVSVGINGISLITNTNEKYTASVIAGNEMVLPTYESDLYGTVQRKITEYKSMRIKYISKGLIQVTLIGVDDSVENAVQEIKIDDTQNLLKDLDVTIQAPQVGVVEGEMGTATNGRGTVVNYKIIINETTIGVSAIKYISNEMTILSYPVTIDDYVNIRIEINKIKSDKYVAILYLDDERADESIELNEIPKINVVGKTFIGNEERFFNGYIKNVKIYN